MSCRVSQLGVDLGTRSGPAAGRFPLVGPGDGPLQGAHAGGELAGVEAELQQQVIESASRLLLVDLSVVDVALGAGLFAALALPQHQREDGSGGR